MSDQPTKDTKKPYDIRERTFLFACDVTRAMLKLHTRGRIAGVLLAVNLLSNSDEELVQEASELMKTAARPRIHSRAPKLDTAENRVLRTASIYPRIPVGCAALTLRTRFTVFADRGARSRPFVNTRPTAQT